MNAALSMSEAAWQSRVIETAILHRWHVQHVRPARTAHGWATPITGHPGGPDLLLARDGIVIGAELKRHGGRATPAQREWLTALGEHGRLWFPTQWTDVLATLRGER